MEELPKRVVGRPFTIGNPGRPKGARNKLGESFVKAMLADFDLHGADTITVVRHTDPSTYLRVIAGLLPKELTGEDGEPLFSSVTVNLVRPGNSSKP